MKNFLHLATSLLLTLALLTGCATAPGSQTFTPQKVEKGVNDAVGIYTAIRLSRFPESRPKFEAARNALAILISNEKWDLAAFAQALTTTGLAQQQSEQVLLIVGQGISLIDTATGNRVDLSQQEYAKAVIVGGFTGLDRTLKSISAPQ